MDIIVTSESELKVRSCRLAFAGCEGANIIPCKVPSGVNEQPFDDETLTGAFNRIRNARVVHPGADYYYSVENGIFNEAGRYIDRAVVAIARGDEDPQYTLSDGVEFPAAAVEIARERGFEQWTVGKIMAEMGIVNRHDDPHLDLSGKSRADYIIETAAKAVAQLNLSR